ncbi:carboxymuconolactone decarboxylase family protein [Sphingobium sp. H39-3-25]|nr:carboxymuconolactone decarboxylase family protein [Sphingobium arseniciresistens]
MVAPGLADYTDDVLFGDVWLRPDLAPRERSIVTLSAMIATGKGPMLAHHLGRALDNGVKPTEISGILTHLAFYTGWPNIVSALPATEEVFKAHKVALPLPDLKGPPGGDARPKAPDPAIVALAPKFEQLTADVLFKNLWLRTDLSPADRSLATISALAANGDEAQLASHVRFGLSNGLTRAQIIEAFTHLAFYAGWPKALSAIRVAGTVFDADKTTKSADPVPVPLEFYAHGQSPTSAEKENFIGSVTMTSRFAGASGTKPRGATVTFQPGARSNWHSHPLGQLLVVTAGHGWIQAEGEPVRAIAAGDVIWTAPGVRHWHGATRASSMTHVGISQALDGKTATWGEPVTDAQYNGPR